MKYYYTLVFVLTDLTALIDSWQKRNFYFKVQ